MNLLQIILWSNDFDFFWHENYGNFLGPVATTWFLGNKCFFVKISKWLLLEKPTLQTMRYFFRKSKESIAEKLEQGC